MEKSLQTNSLRRQIETVTYATINSQKVKQSTKKEKKAWKTGNNSGTTLLKDLQQKSFSRTLRKG